MYNAQIVKERINTIIKKQKISASKLLADCDLNPNTINKISDKNGLASFNLAKIADYLEVSVDYLLGRTDDPHTIGGRSIQTGNIGDNNGNGDTSVKIYNAVQLDETTQQLVKAFQSLDFVEKSKVMGVVAELISK